MAGLKARFDKLDGLRSTHLRRCRDCVDVTVPSLLPKFGSDENTLLPTPYQGLGARAVNNLSAKLLLALFPANTPFFRLDIDEFVADKMKTDMGEENFKTKVTKKLKATERMITKTFEAMAHRTKMFKAIRLLVAIGNALIEMLPSGKIKVYRLDKYVVRRNPAGEPVEIIIQEMVFEEDIPEEVRQNTHANFNGTGNDVKTYPLMTQALLVKKRWHVKQEVLDVEIPGSQATYPEDKSPFIPLTWTLADGENYGRGHVEEYLGDFISYDELSKDLLEAAAAAAKIIYLVKNTATTNIQDLKTARNGQFVQGDEEDIGLLRVDKIADFKMAYDQSNVVATRIAKAFLQTESIQREAERVTAEEVRMMAQELEDALGGVYSVLGVELQGPLARLLMGDMVRRKKMAPLPKEIDVTITTGFEALGRGHDLAKLRELRNELVSVGQAVGDPKAVSKMFKFANYLQQYANALGIDTDELIPSPEELKKMQEQEEMYAKLMEAMNSKAGGELTKGLAEGGMPSMEGMPQNG